MDDIKHYTADLENQVFKLQESSEQVEQSKNSLILEHSELHRRIQRLQEDGKAVQEHLNREIASKDKLQANVSKAEWQRKQLELTISRLKKEKDALQAKADQLGLALQGMPAPVGFKSRARRGDQVSDQVSTLSVVALLTFAAALGVSCACFGSGTCQRILQRRRHRTQSGIDEPPGVMEDGKDVEDQQWRAVAQNSRPPSDGEMNGREDFGVE